MEAIAKAKFVRNSPSKVGQVLTLIRNKSVKQAFNILQFTPKSAKVIIEKTLKSAIANAGKLKNYEGIIVKECYVNQGPSLKRWRSRAFGRAVQYKHKTCHLTIIVSDNKK
ncbi:MAG: 50S ribosomal protein L22 [Elusimicrobia bacterium RIFOXYA2_FULL_39_19]|nr:MAG: 50S ribosomal protein L22 [Elusimicrobia bacterium RIFOXYA2_FULL_39_19]